VTSLHSIYWWILLSVFGTYRTRALGVCMVPYQCNSCDTWNCPHPVVHSLSYFLHFSHIPHDRITCARRITLDWIFTLRLFSQEDAVGLGLYTRDGNRTEPKPNEPRSRTLIFERTEHNRNQTIKVLSLLYNTSSISEDQKWHDLCKTNGEL